MKKFVLICCMLVAAMQIACTGGGSDGGVTVPMVAITVDGDRADWQGVKSVAWDPVGDGNELSGSDIQAVFLASDSGNLYARIDLANGAPSRGLNYMIAMSQEEGSWNLGDIYLSFDVSRGRCTAHKVGVEDGILLANGVVAVSESTIEMSFPLTAPILPASAYVSSTTSTPTIDWIDYVAESSVLSVFW